MSNAKLPKDAFAYYYSLGIRRSYEQVAERFDCSKQTIQTVAARDKWKHQVIALDEEARHRSNERMIETATEMNARHLKVLMWIQGKAIEALKNQPLDSGMDAIRAYMLALNAERLVRGEPTDRAEINIDEVIRREYTRWMRANDTDEWADIDQPTIVEALPVHENGSSEPSTNGNGAVPHGDDELDQLL